MAAALLALAATGPAAAQALNLAQTPLFLGTSVKPNVLVLLDNSQSMDGTMAGRLIAGNDANTRGNIARTVLRDTISSFRGSFRWGLGSFALQNPTLYTTYAYYFGADADVAYTNDCVAGISASRGNRRCVANPQPANGFNFITYAFSGDDPSINDVLYTDDLGPQLYGIGFNNSTRYRVYANRLFGTGWDAASFGGLGQNWSFTPTDAGFLPQTPPHNRMFWLRRAWGWYADVTGAGRINRTVQDDSDAHVNALLGLLATETSSSATGELKNAAVFTPLAGTLDTARSYFAGTLNGTSSPVTDSCQRNFVLLATDGNPTGKTNGQMYSLADQTNTYTPPAAGQASGTWSFGTAASDVFQRITALRATPLGARSLDVQTYVIGLGDSVANASSVAALNRMAQLGGTGSAFLASSAQALSDAFRAIAVDIVSRTASASAVSLNGGSWNTGSRLYQARFGSADWSGQLLAFPVGESGEPAAQPDWDAGRLLNDRHWSLGRQIITYKPGAAIGSRGIPFRWPANPAAPAAGELDAAMVGALNANASGVADGFGQQRLEFLRGNTAREARNCAACAAPVFRNRPATVLGDIVNSPPVYVGGPTSDFRDTIAGERYSTYATARRGATPVVFVGANDGMLHAFHAATGVELFAYVPHAVRSRLSALTANPYTHVYSVDGAPAVGDVFVGGSWRTYLVSGMAAGARGLFALDVTQAGAVNEANAGSVARWEVADADIGHVFGRPILAKMRDGRWRAIVGNGVNSANGRAVLVLVDLETGAVGKIDTMAGSAAAPNGLSAVSVVSQHDDGVADFAFAGDLQGNLWKFDLSAASAASWKVALGSAAVPQPLFTAPAGQPITARPGVTRATGGGWMVVVGTGRYIDVGDNGAGAAQALYGIRDLGVRVTLAELQPQSVVATPVAGGISYRVTTHAVGRPADALLAGDNAISPEDYGGSRRGWRMTLPSAGERVVADLSIRHGRVLVSTLVPGAAACSGGGDGWVMTLDAATGNRIAALDTNADNTVDADDLLAGSAASGLRIGAVPSAASAMRSKDRKHEDYFVTTSNGDRRRIKASGQLLQPRRMGWEQLP